MASIVAARVVVAPRGARRRRRARASSSADEYATACGYDPRDKAKEMISRLHTLVGVRIVMAQLDGQGNECSEDVNQSSVTAAMLKQMETTPLVGTGSEFIESLMRSEDADVRLAATRVIEVRREFGDEFDWDEMKKSLLVDLSQYRLEMLRTHAAKSFDGGA
jgi:hypothetical protein